LPEVVVTVVFVPPFILYVNVNGAVPAVPVKVINGWVALRHTAVVPLIVAFGAGRTYTFVVSTIAGHP
jgi:hypothetical protein